MTELLARLSYLEKRRGPTIGRTPISLETKIEWAMLRLASPVRLKTIANDAGRTESTVAFCVNEVLNAICSLASTEVRCVNFALLVHAYFDAFSRLGWILTWTPRDRFLNHMASTR
jgi:hypothetical protein